MLTSTQKLSRRRAWDRILRTIILVTGLYQVVFGELWVGVAILAALGAITLPAKVSGGRIKAIPLEFELILFFMVVLQFVIGETLNFYDNVPGFDKLVHFTLPFFLGYIIAMLAYTMQATGNLKMTLVPAMFVIVLTTLGLAAAWEIFEYLCDTFFGTYLQGSLTSDPLIDTMNDLIAGTLGGVFGALLAVRYVRKSKKEHDPRLEEFTKEIATDFTNSRPGGAPRNQSR